MDKIEKDIAILHKKKFGKKRTPADALRKLGEEYGELVESVLDNDKSNIKKEAADCIISIVAVLQGYFNRDIINIEQIISDKLNELYERNKIKK